MRLSELLKAFYNLPIAADREIERLILDSRQVRANDLFFCNKGK